MKQPIDEAITRNQCCNETTNQFTSHSNKFFKYFRDHIVIIWPALRIQNFIYIYKLSYNQNVDLILPLILEHELFAL